MEDPFPEESFENKKKIGEGGFGEVYLIEDGERKAVVKYFKSQELDSECEILKDLDHDNIVKYLGTHERNEFYGPQKGILLEYCNRGTLRDAIFDPKLIYSMYWVMCWAKEMFGALAYIHSKNLLHRDIKPTNIFLHGHDFELKLGDFGSTRVFEGTATTAHITTRRYMSPPKLYNAGTAEQLTKEQGSLKNDIYSMGVVFWEIIERRICYSEYGVSTFADQRFLADYWTLRLTEIDDFKCPRNFWELILSCTNFDYTLRSDAEAVESRVIRMIQEYWDNEKPISSPSYDEDQELLLRPIGFDGTEKQVVVDGFLPNKGMIVPDAFDESTQDGEVIEEEIYINRDALKSLYSQKTFDAFKRLTNEERNQVHLQIAEIIESYEKGTIYHSYEYSNTTDQVDYPKELESLDSFLQLIHYNVERDYWATCQLLNKWFLMKTEMSTQGNHMISYRIYYFTIHSLIKQFIEIRRLSYIKRVTFACYFLEKSRDDWFCWKESREPGEEYLEVISKNFNESLDYQGKWVGEDKYIVENERRRGDKRRDPKKWKIDEDLERLEDFESFHFSHNETVEIAAIMGAVEKEKTKIIKFTQFRNDFLIPLGDEMESMIKLPEKLKTILPVPGYIFQLRNPPRASCLCEWECEVIGIPKEYPDPEMQLFCYKCSSERAVNYLQAFIELCDTLNFNQRLPLKPLTEEIFWRIFVFLQLLPDPSLEEEAKPVVLLDLPENYKDNERIPCFDHDWNFFTLSVEVVREALGLAALDEKSFVFIQSPFE